MRYIYRGQDNVQSTGNSNSAFIFKILSLVLLIALIVLSVLYIRGIARPSNDSTLQSIKTLANNEIRLGISEAENLSRTGSSSTTSSIGKVRQYVHGLEVLNNLHNQLSGGERIVPQQLLMNAQAIIDAFIMQHQAGQNISTELNNLLNVMHNIQDNMSFAEEAN